MALTPAQKQQARQIVNDARDNPNQDFTLKGRHLILLLKLSHRRGYRDGNYDHGQNWGDRADYRELEFIDGRELDTNEDDNPENVGG